MILDSETLEALGGGDQWGVVTFDLDRARRFDLTSRAIANLEYQKTENYRAAHRAAALAYYHANKARPGARVRGDQTTPAYKEAHRVACRKYRANKSSPRAAISSQARAAAVAQS